MEPLTGKELEEWEASRNLLEEINSGIDEMLEINRLDKEFPVPELSPCPFCGSKVYSYEDEFGKNNEEFIKFFVECSCGISMKSSMLNYYKYPTVEQLQEIRFRVIEFIERWNKRI